MSEEINKYIDSKIANSLSSPAPDNFTDKLMREIELGKEFEKQDKKVGFSVKLIISGITVLITAFVFAFSYYVSRQLVIEESTTSRDYGFISRYLSDFFSNSLSLFGITISQEVFIYSAGIIILVALGTLVDKYIFRKSY